MDGLSSTVADAVRLCHRIGFQYLWVDALCIIQNDKADWERESRNMSTVYGNAALTITTPIVCDSSQSFIEARRTSSAAISVLDNMARIPSEDRQTGLQRAVWIGTKQMFEGSWFLEHGNGWESVVGHFEKPQQWTSRAWTLQEWILSPRVLHLHAQTVWDCFEGIANEKTRRVKVHPTSLRRDLSSPNSRPRWSEIVSEFMARSIRHEADRPLALEGLVKAYSEATGCNLDTYIAGLWLADLPFDLLWQSIISGQHRAFKRSPVYPSFSWLSLPGYVSFKLNGFGYSPRSLTTYIALLPPHGNETTLWDNSHSLSLSFTALFALSRQLLHSRLKNGF